MLYTEIQIHNTYINASTTTSNHSQCFLSLYVDICNIILPPIMHKGNTLKYVWLQIDSRYVLQLMPVSVADFHGITSFLWGTWNFFLFGFPSVIYTCQWHSYFCLSDLAGINGQTVWKIHTHKKLFSPLVVSSIKYAFYPFVVTINKNAIEHVISHKYCLCIHSISPGLWSNMNKDNFSVYSFNIYVYLYIYYIFLFAVQQIH